MVSTATTLGGFTFDNCLMNAAGVWCMTKEELDAVKNSKAGTFVTKQQPWTTARVIQNHVIRMFRLVLSIRWVYQIRAWLTIWIIY